MRRPPLTAPRGTGEDDREGGPRLYVAATPLGNREDVTLRVLETLRRVPLVIAEDTRRARSLFAIYGIEGKRVESLFKGKEEVRTDDLIEKIRGAGEAVLISEAGTPVISDPGYLLVERCRREGVPVIPLPGPCAAVAALSVAGLPAEPFLFLGFSPRKPGELRHYLEGYLSLPFTLVLYESPLRIAKTLEALRELAPRRPLFLAREMTKLFEEHLSGSAEELLAALTGREIKGEITLVVGRGEKRPPRPESREELVEILLRETGLSLKRLERLLRRETPA